MWSRSRINIFFLESEVELLKLRELESDLLKLRESELDFKSSNLIASFPKKYMFYEKVFGFWKPPLNFEILFIQAHSCS